MDNQTQGAVRIKAIAKIAGKHGMIMFYLTIHVFVLYMIIFAALFLGFDSLFSSILKLAPAVLWFSIGVLAVWLYRPSIFKNLNVILTFPFALGMLIWPILFWLPESK